MGLGLPPMRNPWICLPSIRYICFYLDRAESVRFNSAEWSQHLRLYSVVLLLSLQQKQRHHQDQYCQFSNTDTIISTKVNLFTIREWSPLLCPKKQERDGKEQEPMSSILKIKLMWSIVASFLGACLSSILSRRRIMKPNSPIAFLTHIPT